MHLIVAHAVAPDADDVGSLSAWRERSLPHLNSLLRRWQVVHEDLQEPSTLSTPDERAVARALRWDFHDGHLPWAAWQRQAPAGQAWGQLTPCHWSASAEHIRLANPQSLALTQEDSLALFESVRSLWTDDGYEVVWHAPAVWYVSHPVLAEMPCASLDRVVGRQLDAWLGQDPRVRQVRRLQSEVQMVWHSHPVNARREDQGLPAINSVWLSGCGVLGQASPAELEPWQWEVSLREAAWDADTTAWQAAFEALDARIAAWCDPVSDPKLQRLTLCGERGSRTWAPATTQRLSWRNLWPRWRMSSAHRERAWEGL